MFLVPLSKYVHQRVYSISRLIEHQEYQCKLAAARTEEEANRIALEMIPPMSGATFSRDVTDFVAKARLPVVRKYNYNARPRRMSILALREAKRRTGATPQVWEVSIGVRPLGMYETEYFYCALRFEKKEDAALFKLFWSSGSTGEK